MRAGKGRVPVADQSLTRLLHSGFSYQLVEQLVAGNQLVVRIVSRLDRLRIVCERLFVTTDFFQHIAPGGQCRSEEHTSELQSHSDLVCRLLLEKKKLLIAAEEAC